MKTQLSETLEFEARPGGESVLTDTANGVRVEISAEESRMLFTCSKFAAAVKTPMTIRQDEDAPEIVLEGPALTVLVDALEELRDAETQNRVEL